jgi:probable rRNA maturation factor
MDEPGTTDVLSFPMDMPEGKHDAVVLGDIVIDPIVAATQAKSAGHSSSHEIYILAIHGLLHILGYDHADRDEEKVMFELQERIVKKWEER